jgi:flagellar hook protein FlgE
VNSNPPASPIPTQGAEITPISLNFGNFGLLDTGERNGLYSDADGSYKIVNGVNTYVPDSTAYAASQNGYTEGQLQGISFDPTGVIGGVFSNGQTVGLAQVALEQVQNPDGLSQTGNNDYTLSPNAGPSQVGQAGQGNFGTIQDDSLEGSNVDLTTELSNMILAQRSFDTDSRMIAVVNEMMDTLDHLGE